MRPRVDTLTCVVSGAALVVVTLTACTADTPSEPDTDAAVTDVASPDPDASATDVDVVEDADGDLTDVADGAPGDASPDTPDVPDGTPPDVDAAPGDSGLPEPPPGCRGEWTEGPLTFEHGGIRHTVEDLGDAITPSPIYPALRIRTSPADDRPRRVTPAGGVGGGGRSWWVDGDIGCNHRWIVRVFDGARLRVQDRSLGEVVLNEWPRGGFELGAPGEGSTWAHTLTPDAMWLGFGARTGPLDRLGTQMTFWNTDAYDPAHGGFAPDADPLYTSFPFGMEVRDRSVVGLFVAHHERMHVDLGATDPTRAVWTLTSDEVTRVLISRRTMAEVSEAWMHWSGRPSRLPRWALGYHQSRWGYADADEVLSIAREFRARSIPLDAMWLDIQHMDRFRSFTFDPVHFADPVAMNDALEAIDVRTVAIVDPGIAVADDWDLYREARDARIFMQWPDGRDFVGTAWPGDVSFLGFWSGGADAWWQRGIAALVERGVDGIWLDLNEPTTFPEGGGGTTIPGEVLGALMDYDGPELNPWMPAPTPMSWLHNLYANRQASSTWRAMDSLGIDRPFIVSRAGYPGIQHHAGLWTGDVPSTWEGLASTWRMLLNMGVSGVPYVGSDIGGYSGHATPELFARWMQVGSVSPLARGHVTSGVPGQEPWRFGTEVEDISRFALRDRYALMPYLHTLMAESSTPESGAPWLRPIAWYHPDDPIARQVDDAAFLGPWLMVAPILEPDVTTRTVYLPDGAWLDWRSGRRFDGPQTIDLDVTLGALPIFMRAGAIVPRVKPTEHSEAAFETDTLWIDVFPVDAASGLPTFFDDGRASVSHIDADDQAFINWSTRFWPGHDGEVDGHDPGPHAEPVIEVTASRTDGRYFRPHERDIVRVRPIDVVPTEVRFEDRDSGHVEVVPRVASMPTDTGELVWWFDENARSVEVAVPFYAELRRAGWVVSIDADLATDPAPPVRVDFEVRVPAGTPVDPPVHIASDATDWRHVPMDWAVPGEVAVGSIVVPRGEWFEWKFTRGSWDTVEKWPDCVEATNRYGYGEAGLRDETVWAWADRCE